MKIIPIISVVGESGSGKTTFLEKLIRDLKARNIKVGIIKHHPHSEIEIDRPGKDTWRHYNAGADAVAISTPGKIAVFKRLEAEMELDAIAQALGDADIILTEGYKKGNKLKIEVNRAVNGKSLVSDKPDLIAIVSDIKWDKGVPVFGLEDSAGVADLLIKSFIVTRG
ncbi:MAG: molybdopterin-guanine dinucleotide biosynthesis protein B [Bacillota bacterium]